MLRNAYVCVLMLATLIHFTFPTVVSVAADTTWRAGLARVCITPTEPVRMSGYAGRNTPSTGVASDLFAKALALEDSTGQKAVIITTDLIGFRANVADGICLAIMERTGLARKQILLNSSHTHTGPTVSLDGADLDYSGEHAEATVRYTQRLRDQLVSIVVSALAGLETCQLSWGEGIAQFVMNRREFTDQGVILGVNPRGHVDRSVPVLRIDHPSGELRGVLFGAACHNTTLGSRDTQISGDYAGYAQAVIEKQFPDAQAMFMQGCAGDANPHPRGEEAIAHKHGLDLGNEVIRVLATKLKPIAGPLHVTLSPVHLPLQSQMSKAEIELMRKGQGGWRGGVADGLLKILETDGKLPESYSTPIALWQFGPDLTMVGLSGEVVVDYVTMLEDALGPRRLWTAAYCNDVFGYLPSARVLEQGGYETRGLYYGFGLFSRDAQNVLVEHVRQMAEHARREAM